MSSAGGRAPAPPIAGRRAADSICGMTARVALVTGSTRGLGRAIATRLGADGLGVAVNGLHDDDVQAVADEIRTAGGVADGFAADVTDERAVTELVAAV